MFKGLRRAVKKSKSPDGLVVLPPGSDTSDVEDQDFPDIPGETLRNSNLRKIQRRYSELISRSGAAHNTDLDAAFSSTSNNRVYYGLDNPSKPRDYTTENFLEVGDHGGEKLNTDSFKNQQEESYQSFESQWGADIDQTATEPDGIELEISDPKKKKTSTPIVEDTINGDMGAASIAMQVQVEEIGQNPIAWTDPFSQSSVYSSSSGHASPVPGAGDYANMFAHHPYGPSANRTRTSSNASFIQSWEIPSQSPASVTSTMAYTWNNDKSPVPSNLPYLTTSYPTASMPISAGVNPMSEYGHFDPKSLAQRDEGVQEADDQASKTSHKTNHISPGAELKSIENGSTLLDERSDKSKTPIGSYAFTFGSHSYNPQVKSRAMWSHPFDNTGHLAVPSFADPLGPIPSPVLASSSSTPEVLVCDKYPELHASSFTGKYRKGNLARHMRLKHKTSYQGYKCEAAGCEKTYRRQDALLDHQRRKHQYVSLPQRTPRDPWDMPNLASSKVSSIQPSMSLLRPTSPEATTNTYTKTSQDPKDAENESAQHESKNIDYVGQGRDILQEAASMDYEDKIVTSHVIRSIKEALTEESMQNHRDITELHRSKKNGERMEDMKSQYDYLFEAEDDNISAPSSYCNSVFSVQSLASSASTFSSGSGYSADQIATATRELVLIFQEDEILVPLYKTAVESPSIGSDRLQRNLRRLFKQYAEHLESEAIDRLQYLASRLVSIKARYLAESIIENLQGIAASKHVQKDSSDEEEEYRGSVHDGNFEDLVVFREFLMTSDAFGTFRTQVQ
jgi:hypothetical protein